MKYKVGDKVRVRNDLKFGYEYGMHSFTSDMSRFCGKIVTIKSVHKGDYRIVECEYWWTDEMFEPVEEMSAEEAFMTLGELCDNTDCRNCPITEIQKGLACFETRRKHPKEVLEILKQWKADHKKKPIETEFVWYVQIIEVDTHTLKYEEKVEIDIKSMDAKKKEILEKYCSEHDGKYYAISERRCVVKE